MKETNIDCMKYRKSTHLAGVDVEAMIAEKGDCILTIKEAYHDNIDVNGKKLDGYYIHFFEDVKPMKVNSINRKTIAKILKTSFGLSSVDSRNIGNWINLKIDLFFDPNVKFGHDIVGGIRVSEKAIVLPTLEKDTKLFLQCQNAVKSNTYTIEQIKTKYQVSEEIEKLLSL